MTVAVAEAIVRLVEIYVLAGFAHALVFLPRAVTRLDPRVAGAPRVLRLLIAPGVVALWPLFAWRLLTRAAEPVETNSHRRGAASRISRPGARQVRTRVR